MTIEQRLKDDTAGLDCNREDIGDVAETKAMLTRVLALIDAVEGVATARVPERYSICHICEQDLCWHVPEKCPWAQMQNALKALKAAGDIEARRTPAPAFGPWTKVSEIDCRTEAGDIEGKEKRDGH